MALPCGCEETACTCALTEEDGFFEVVGDGSAGDTYRVRVQPLYVHLRSSVNVDVPDFESFHVPWDTAIANPYGMWSSDYPSRILIPEPGLYAACATVDWDANTSGRRFASIDISSRFDTLGSNNLLPHSNNLILTIQGSAEVDIGEYLQLLVFQDSGGTRQVLTGQTTLAVWRAGALKA